MDNIVSKEAHILELGNWGRTLDKEIEGKNDIINSQQHEIEDQSLKLSVMGIATKKFEEEKLIWAQSESFLKELINKQAIAIENLSFVVKERAELQLRLEKELTEKDALENF
ncbi:MAG: hypothetical protein WDO19_17510 [Bacteroidota bacterium]